MASCKNEDTRATFKVACHCGRLQAKFTCSATEVIAWDCDCSDCYMRRNIHVIVPQSDFQFVGAESLEDCAILYEWGTKTAKRYFCRTCGILPFYVPRSNPDGVAITIACVVGWRDENCRPKIVVRKYDGQNWERSHVETGIAQQSKPAAH